MQNLENKFRQRVRDLIGARCSAVHGTSGVGSMITILFGPRRMTSVTLPSFGTFEHDMSDISINLESAAWRLEEGEKVLCTSSSQNGVASPMDLGLSKLEAQTVISAEVLEPFFDLCIRFSGNTVFRVFCDQVESDNYTIKVAPEYFTVGPDGKIRYEICAND